MERTARQENLFIENLQIIFPVVFVLFVYFILSGFKETSIVSSSSFFKRVDELDGMRSGGRQMAAYGNWQPIYSPNKIKLTSISIKEIAKEAIAASDNKDETFIDGNISYELIEAFNPQKFAVNVKPTQFSGSIEIDKNTIRSMGVSLPDGTSIRLSYTDIIGKRVFKYDHEGEELSGLIYQADDDIFVLSFVNGPYTGTRLKFGKEKIIDQAVEAQSQVATNGQSNDVTQPETQTQQIDGFQL